MLPAFKFAIFKQHENVVKIINEDIEYKRN